MNTVIDIDIGRRAGRDRESANQTDGNRGRDRLRAVGRSAHLLGSAGGRETILMTRGESGGVTEIDHQEMTESQGIGKGIEYAAFGSSGNYDIMKF